MKPTTTAIPKGWTFCPLGSLLREIDVRVMDLPRDQRKSIELLSLTKRFGLIPQSQRFEKRVATENVDKYKVVRPGWIVYNRSEEHTSELQSPCNLLCHLLLEKKNKKQHKKENHPENNAPLRSSATHNST